MEQLKHYVVTERINPEPTTSGIYIPQKLKKYQELKVLRGSNGDLPKPLEEGMEVWVKSGTGTEANLEGKKILIISLGDIILIP